MSLISTLRSLVMLVWWFPAKNMMTVFDVKYFDETSDL